MIINSIFEDIDRILYELTVRVFIHHSIYIIPGGLIGPIAGQ